MLLADRRSPAWPAIATTAGEGLPGVAAELGIGWIGPAGLKPAISARMEGELRGVLQQGPVASRLSERGFDASFLGREAFAEQLRSDRQRWQAVLRKVHITQG